MHQIRIAGKRVQIIELYLYVLAALMAALAFFVTLRVRSALSPVIFSPYTFYFWDAFFVVAGATLTKVALRVYEHSTAESRLKFLQLLVTATLVFLVTAIAVF